MTYSERPDMLDIELPADYHKEPPFPLLELFLLVATFVIVANFIGG